MTTKSTSTDDNCIVSNSKVAVMMIVDVHVDDAIRDGPLVCFR